MLSETLKKLRENSGYTQQQVANALNLERSTYSYYETGKTTPDINTVIKLAKIFNVSYIDIFEEEEKQQTCRLKDNEIDVKHNENRNLSHIYELKKDEKRLISFYRVLSEEEKQSLLDYISEKVISIVKKR
ncbi:MAG: helix-turn-helix domain-containing protein [Oscillospiraceae bacterium]|jgi:transcriptional regulator with XRE-family HTH domain|nr:helix-turn-helix domain-containing protein [Oscillospiraceae bacterium]